MKRKIFLFSTTFLSIFLFTSIYVQSNNFVADDKPNSKECPYLQNLGENKCPYLEGKLENKNLDCPYLQGKIESDYNDKELNPDACPFLKNEKEGNKAYPKLKNTSI
jgi:hypothetical protein